MKDKVILAYSGGLDTSVILKWLANKGFDVIAYVADVGQKEDFKAVEEKAYATGASKVYIEDLRKPLVTDYVFPALKANTIYEGTYMLGTSLARPIIAKRHIEIAKKEGTKYVAHGATGKGNDQVRFEFGYYMNMPDVKIISPWKDEEWLSQFEGRSDMLKYAEENGIPVKLRRRSRTARMRTSSTSHTRLGSSRIRRRDALRTSTRSPSPLRRPQTRRPSSPSRSRTEYLFR